MNERELDIVKQEILSRFPKDNGQKSRGTFVNDPLFLRSFNSKTFALTSQYTGLVSHDEYKLIIERMNRFYSSVTPEEIQILNTSVEKCMYCGEMLTSDEFPKCDSIPFDLLNSFFKSEYVYDRDNGAYCSNCIYKVPIEKQRKYRPGYVYITKTGRGYKLGWSTQPEKRVKQLTPDYGETSLLGSIYFDDAYTSEQHIHLIFWHRHIERELFSLSDTDLDYLLRKSGNKPE